VLIALHKGAEMTKHTTKGLISVQILKGELKFKTEDQSVKLRTGHILTLCGGVPHNLKAKKTTIFLLTLTSAPGDNDKNHISDIIMDQNKVNGKTVIRETVYYNVNFYIS
jgi:quercetin dioxygenase-like cupin family protein